MSQIRDLAAALMDALDKVCRDSYAVIPEISRNSHGDICPTCLVTGLIDHLAVHPNPEVQALAHELLNHNGHCGGWHEDC